MNYNGTSLDQAKIYDQQDQLASFRNEFEFPQAAGEFPLYFAGHSLGLMPKKAREFINAELEDWGKLGVEGHFKARHPWLPYHEFITESFSRLMGAKPEEVVAMNTLTANLHFMLVSFYRPTRTRYKILIENNTFPSDKYAVDSQARFHGFDPKDAIVELVPRENEMTIREEDLSAQIDELGDSLALVLLGNCNYLSGQCFDFENVVKHGHKNGAYIGFNLAHGAGNLSPRLHEWNVDFAVWCSYKYLNSGPGSIAGAFVHSHHLGKKDIPRFEGWWGTNKDTRFKMGPDFDPISTVEAWQLSNPPIFQLAALRASMDLFDRAGLENLRAKGDHLTGYLEYLLKEECPKHVSIVTPEKRGSMLCIKIVTDEPKKMVETFHAKGVFVDFREPDILRMTPIPLYTSYQDVYHLVQVIKGCLNG